MKIFVAAVSFILALFVACSVDGILGGAMSTDLDAFNFCLSVVVIALLAFNFSENKELKNEIKELRKKVEEVITSDKTEE